MQTNYDAIVKGINKMRRKLIFAKLLLLAIALCLIGCQGKEEIEEKSSTGTSPPSVVKTPVPSPQKCSSDSLIYEEILHTKSNEKERWGDLKVLIYMDCINNLLIKVIDVQDDFLVGAAGIGNSGVKGFKNHQVIERCELIINEFPEFVIGTYIEGSTYGSEAMFIIWCNGDEWNIIRTPFQAARLEDRDKDGIMEIVERYNAKSKNGDTYRFKEGCFERI